MIIKIGIISFSRGHAGDDAGDAGVDGAGLHRHAEEAADDDDEQRDVDGAEELAVVPEADVPRLVFDPYNPLIGALIESSRIFCGSCSICW